jgi:hypothetical protein
LFICIIAITSAYRSAKSTYLLFLSIPQKLKEKFNIGMTFGKENPKYNYLRIIIFSSKSNVPLFFFRYLSQKRIQIIIANNIDNNINFQKWMFMIGKKYRQQQIYLTRWGLSTIIQSKKWKTLAPHEIEDCINKLIIISENEGLEIIKNK